MEYADLQGFRIVDISALATVLASLRCPSCIKGNVCLEEDEESKTGLAKHRCRTPIGLVKFTCVMNMLPPMNENSYRDHVKALRNAAESVAKVSKAAGQWGQGVLWACLGWPLWHCCLQWWDRLGGKGGFPHRMGWWQPCQQSQAKL